MSNYFIHPNAKTQSCFLFHKSLPSATEGVLLVFSSYALLFVSIFWMLLNILEAKINSLADLEPLTIPSMNQQSKLPFVAHRCLFIWTIHEIHILIFLVTRSMLITAPARMTRTAKKIYLENNRLVQHRLLTIMKMMRYSLLYSLNEYL